MSLNSLFTYLMLKLVYSNKIFFLYFLRFKQIKVIISNQEKKKKTKKMHKNIINYVRKKK